MIKISKQIDYALVLLSYIAKQEKPISAKLLSHRLQLPIFFTANILKKLLKKGILKSELGASGGYYLIDSPENISIYKVMISLDDPLQIVDCISDDKQCKTFDQCMLKNSAFFIQEQFLIFLKDLNLLDIIKSSEDKHYYEHRVFSKQH